MTHIAARGFRWEPLSERRGRQPNLLLTLTIFTSREITRPGTLSICCLALQYVGKPALFVGFPVGALCQGHLIRGMESFLREHTSSLGSMKLFNFRASMTSSSLSDKHIFGACGGISYFVACCLDGVRANKLASYTVSTLKSNVRAARRPDMTRYIVGFRRNREAKNAVITTPVSVGHKKIQRARLRSSGETSNRISFTRLFTAFVTSSFAVRDATFVA